MELVFSLDNFLSFFPEFDSEGYAKSNVQAHGKRATMHIGRFVEGMPLPPDKREYALFLMTAHLLELDSQNGRSSGDGNSSIAGAPYKATIGSVQIESTKPNSFTSDDWNYWLNQTKHGRELLAFLDLAAPLGVYLNGPKDSVRDLV